MENTEYKLPSSFDFSHEIFQQIIIDDQLPFFNNLSFRTKGNFSKVLNKSVEIHFKTIRSNGRVKENLLKFNNINYKNFFKDKSFKVGFEKLRNTNFKNVFWGVAMKNNIVLIYAPDKMYFKYLRMYVKKCILISIILQIESVFTGLPRYVRNSNFDNLIKETKYGFYLKSKDNLNGLLRAEAGNGDVELISEISSVPKKGFLRNEEAASILKWDYESSPNHLMNASVEVLFKSVQYFLSTQKVSISKSRKLERKRKDKERKRLNYKRIKPSPQEQCNFIQEYVQKYNKIHYTEIADLLNVTERTIRTRVNEMELFLD